METQTVSTNAPSRPYYEDFERTKYELISAKVIGTEFQHVRTIGHSLLHEGTDFYIVKLWMFPNDTYYLCKNYSNEAAYTLFAKMVENADGTHKFLNPVGYGRLRHEFKDYMEMTFRMPFMRMYMSLFPDE